MTPEPTTAQSPWTIARLLKWTAGHFREKGVDEPRLAAEILLAHALGCQRIHLYTRFDEVPGQDVLNTLRELVREGALLTPIAYLVGYKEFFSLTFEVTRDVLVPRPETEMLVESAINLCGSARGAAAQFLELGTGSGCVAIAILKQLPEAHATATDISAAAIEVARRNADRHAVANRIAFVEADRLKLPPNVVPTSGFDWIVSNPPYVSKADMASLPANVREHEPTIALTPGGDGLDFYRAMAVDGPGVLQTGGSVLVEIGAGQGDDVANVFTQDGAFDHVETHRSPTDPHDRVMRFAKV